jgi:DNA-binding LacI/PurR family transcriptional regulator
VLDSYTYKQLRWLHDLDAENLVTSPKNPRQSDIARLAGVSQATVSLVLTGRAAASRIPEVTQERIRQAMAELDYVPNAAARSLRGGRNNLIGVHTFERVFPVSPEDYYHEFLNGIEEQAVRSGLDLVLFASTQRADGTRSIYGNGSNRLRLADGAIIFGFEKNDEELRRLSGEGYPFVFIGHREISGVSIPYVTADYSAAMAPVADLLASAGHSDVAYLAASTRGFPQRERLDGFTRAATDRGLVVHVFEGAPSELDAGRVAAVLSAGSTALVAETYELARALHAALLTLGLDPGGDVSVVSLDSDPRGDAFSHVHVPRRDMGRRAVSLLLDVIAGESSAGHVETVACEPPTAETVRPPAPARPPGAAPASAAV